ncbi:13498_t:CDS:2, partial [Acaulospora colombiana]
GDIPASDPSLTAQISAKKKIRTSLQIRVYLSAKKTIGAWAYGPNFNSIRNDGLRDRRPVVVIKRHQGSTSPGIVLILLWGKYKLGQCGNYGWWQARENPGSPLDAHHGIHVIMSNPSTPQTDADR